MQIDLKSFRNHDFDRGASALKEGAWRLVQQFIFGIDVFRAYGFKSSVLSLFGARLQRGLILKPRVRITFPWKLVIGENTWIGEGVWLLNLASIEIGSNVCISQDAFLCTGSHDWSMSTFPLVTQQIIIQDNVWVCARVFVAPGVTIGEGSIVTAGSVVLCDMPAGMICSGNPCRPVKKRPPPKNDRVDDMSSSIEREKNI